MLAVLYWKWKAFLFPYIWWWSVADCPVGEPYILGKDDILDFLESFDPEEARWWTKIGRGHVKMGGEGLVEEKQRGRNPRKHTGRRDAGLPGNPQAQGSCSDVLQQVPQWLSEPHHPQVGRGCHWDCGRWTKPQIRESAFISNHKCNTAVKPLWMGVSPGDGVFNSPPPTPIATGDTWGIILNIVASPWEKTANRCFKLLC